MRKAPWLIASAFLLGIIAQVCGVSFAAANPPALGGTGTTAVPVSGQTLIGNGAGTYTPAVLTPGANVVITNGSGTITIAVNGGSFLPSSTVYVSSVNGLTGAVTITSSTLGTATNTISLFNGNGFTTTTIQAVLNALSASGLLTYNSSTGVFGFTSSTLALGSASHNNTADFLASTTVYVATVNGQSGAVSITSSTLGVATNTVSLFNGSGYITQNQTITFTASGDATGTASGQTSLLPSITVTGLQGKALPALSTGTLKYTGGAWTFDGNVYLLSGINVTTTAPLGGGGALTSAGLTLTCATCLTANQTITLSGAVTGSGATAITTTYTTSTLFGFFSAVSPIVYNSSTGQFSWTNSNGYISSISINGNSGTSFQIAAGSGVTSTVSGTTTTLSLNLSAICSGNQFLTGVSPTGTGICGTPSGGSSSTNVFGTNGVSVVQVGVNATASLDTTYAASWSAIQTFLKGATINATATLASTTNCNILNTNGSGTIGCNNTSYLTAAIQTLFGLSTSTISVTTGTQAGTFNIVTQNGNTIKLIFPPANDQYFAPSTTIPTNTNQLTNGANFITSSSVGLLAPATSTINASGTTVTGPAFTFSSSTTILPYASGTSLYWALVNTGNWAGTWQGVNSSTFCLASSCITTSTNNFGGLTNASITANAPITWSAGSVIGFNTSTAMSLSGLYTLVDGLTVNSTATFNSSTVFTTLSNVSSSCASGLWYGTSTGNVNCLGIGGGLSILNGNLTSTISGGGGGGSGAAPATTTIIIGGTNTTSTTFTFATTTPITLGVNGTTITWGFNTSTPLTFGSLITFLGGVFHNSTTTFSVPPQSTSSAEVQFGTSTLQNGNGSGTLIGSNLTSSWNGDFVNFQVNSSSKFNIASSGNTLVGGTLNSSGSITTNGVQVTTGTTYTAQGTSISVTNLTVATSGAPLLSASVAGTTLTLTSVATSTILAGYSSSTVAGSTNQIAYFNGTNTITGNNNLQWNNAASLLTLNGSSTWAIPNATSTGITMLLGTSTVIGGSPSGTLIGSNLVSTWNGDFVNLQVNSSTQFRVASSGYVTANYVSSSQQFVNSSTINGLAFTNTTGTHATITNVSSTNGDFVTRLTLGGNSVATSTAPSLAGTYLGTLNNGTQLTASSTLASSTLNLTIENPTTTAPAYTMATWDFQRTFTKIGCVDAAGTTTLQFWNTTAITTTTKNADIVSGTLACGISGNSTTTFTSSTLLANYALLINVTSTASTPTQTRVYLIGTKQ